MFAGNVTEMNINEKKHFKSSLCLFSFYFQEGKKDRLNNLLRTITTCRGNLQVS